MLQDRLVRSGLITSVKVSGIPIGLSTSRQAPVLERLRTMQSMLPAWSKEIDPPLMVRCRCS
jgi:hypothetical protein